jgi:hypothetical protein
VLARRIENLPSGKLSFEAEELKEAVGKLEQLSSELKHGEVFDRESALLALDEVERALARFSEGRRPGPAGDDAVESALQQLAADPFGSDLTEAARSGDASRLRDAVLATANALSSGELSRQERAEQIEGLGELLREVARELRRNGLIDQAHALDELARALEDGDLERAEELLDSSSMLDAFAGIGERTVDQRVAQDLIEAVNLARYLLGRGKPLPLGAGCSRPGEGTAGVGPGTGSTNEEAEGFETGEAVLRDRQSDATSDRRGSYESLYEPHIIEAESWVDVQVKAGTGASGSFLSEIGRSAGTGDEATHRTRFLAAPANGSPERAAELERVPPGYRDVVRRYFSRQEQPANQGEERE